jgi:hypothetical protein
MHTAGLPSNLVSITAGRHHAAALTSDGLIYTWGRNDRGQLGRTTADYTTDNTVKQISPTPALLPSFAGEKCAKIALGRYHSIVLTDAGSVYVFGTNLWGQIGPKTPEGKNIPGTLDSNPEPYRLPGDLFPGGMVTDIATGQLHTLILTDSGRVYGFGRNTKGQLASTEGFGLGIPISTPVCMSCALPRGYVAESVAGGSDHTLIVARYVHVPDSEDVGFTYTHTRRRVVFSVGANSYGQLGTQTADINGATWRFSRIQDAGWGGCAVSNSDPNTCITGEMEPQYVYAGCDQTFVVTRRPVCPPGAYGDLGMQPCVPCLAGRYNTGANFDRGIGGTECAACGISLFSYAGSTLCLNCPAGMVCVCMYVCNVCVCVHV